MQNKTSDRGGPAIDLTKIPRGKPVRGARALAEHIFGDLDSASSVYGLDRAQFGIQILAGKLVARFNQFEMIW
jgi:hypothetical protein